MVQMVGLAKERMKGGITMEIRIDKTKHSCGKGSQYHAVLKNPYVNYYDSKVIWGSTPEIVQRKAEQQLKKWGQVHILPPGSIS